MPKPYYFRDFLNIPGHHAGAYVLAVVDVEDADDSPLGPRLDANLTVADCGRIARLEFTCYDAEDVDNALHKARLLRGVVDEFVAALEEHADAFRQVIAVHDDEERRSGA